MAEKKTYDLFITHAWRYHHDWSEASQMLDADQTRIWRNFSVPWYDPALDPNTPLGRRNLDRSLESQVYPVDALLFLAGVHAINSARQWVMVELELARKLNKPVIGLPAHGQTEMPAELAALVDTVTAWRPDALAATIEEVRAARPAVSA